MKNRFNLEDEINSLHSFAEQIATISEAIMENQLTTDETVNVLEGLKVMINLHAAKLHDTMCQCFQLDNYRDVENRF